jgi:hypothetical protein
VKRVNELDFYSLGLRDLARKLKVSPTRLLWLIQQEGMQRDPEFFKEIKIGKSNHKRYSAKCLGALKEHLEEIDLHEAFATRKAQTLA